MASEESGRSAPWARALGALLGCVVLSVIAFLVYQKVSEDRREDAAFEATVDQANRHVSRVLEQPDENLANEGGIREVLTSASQKGKSAGRLVAFKRAGGEVTTVVLFSESYERFAPALGPATDLMDRCFTITYTGVGTSDIAADVIPHGRDASCADIAERIRPDEP